MRLRLWQELFPAKEASFFVFAILPSRPSPGSLQIFVRDYRREGGLAENPAAVAGKPVDRGCGQSLKLHLPAPRSDFLAVKLAPFEHHDSRDWEPRFVCDLKLQLLLPALV